MKSFYRTEIGTRQAAAASMSVSPPVHERALLSLGSRARIAVYDGPAAAPQVVEVCSEDPSEYIGSLSSRIYELASERGGSIPYTVIRELTENLIHANFAEPVISVLDGGRVLRFADQGPGIADKDRAVLPGFTTASGEAKRYIRGVGSGLPIVKDFLAVSGGSLTIEDNLGCGAVVTIAASTTECSSPVSPQIEGHCSTEAVLPLSFDTRPVIRLTTRQKQVLALVMESGSAGPSIVSRELGVGLSTAYRDLASLEELGLIESVGGKRTLTENGITYLDDFSSGN